MLEVRLKNAVSRAHIVNIHTRIALSLSRTVRKNLRLGFPCWGRHVWTDRTTATLANSPDTCVFGLLSIYPWLLDVSNTYLQPVPPSSYSQAESYLGLAESPWCKKTPKCILNTVSIEYSYYTKTALLYKTPNLGVSVTRPNVLPKLWSIWLPVIKYLTGNFAAGWA